jgi:hypothetical protein
MSEVPLSPEKAAAEAFAKGLIPRVVFEGACMAAGVVAYLMTDQIVWIIAGALAGGLPLLLFVLRHARNAKPRGGGTGSIVE